MTIWGGGLRWSYSSQAWLGLFANLQDGRVLLRHEMSWNGVSCEEAAEDIVKEIKRKKIYLQGGIVGNPEMFPKPDEYGPTDSEIFTGFGLPMRRGSEDRVNGWSRVRSWLHPRKLLDGSVGPMLIIHPSCRIIIRALPAMVSDPKNTDDIEESPDEYPVTGLRLYLMSRPLPTPEAQKEPPPPGTWGHALRHVLSPRPGRPVLGSDAVMRR